MSEKSKTSQTFRLLNRFHLINDVERYGCLNPFYLIIFALKTLWRRFLFNFAFKAYILEFSL